MKKTTILLSVLLAGFMTGCSSGRALSPDSNRAGSNSRSPTVHVFEVQASPGSAGETMLIPAALSVEGAPVVLAQREGRIVNLRVQEGARVTKGEILAQFNDDDQRSQLRQAELEVSRLQVEEQQYEALVKLNRSELEREVTLAKAGVSSKADVERAQYKLDQAIKEYEKTKLATESARARIEAVKLELEKSTVRAPIDGVITHRYIALGTNVARNDKLFEVSKLAPLEVKFQVPQSEKDRLTPGLIVELAAVNGDQVVARARVRRIDPVADATVHTFGYVADVIGGPGLMPGLAVNVRLARSAGATACWVPRAAFPVRADLHNGATVTLFVTEGGKCLARNVVIKALEGDQVEVVSGIAAGDKVILAPAAELKDGDIVEVSPR